MDDNVLESVVKVEEESLQFPVDCNTLLKEDMNLQSDPLPSLPSASVKIEPEDFEEEMILPDRNCHPSIKEEHNVIQQIQQRWQHLMFRPQANSSTATTDSHELEMPVGDTLAIKEELEEELPLPELVTVGNTVEGHAKELESPFSQDLNLSDPLSGRQSVSVSETPEENLEVAGSPFPFPTAAVAEQVDLEGEGNVHLDVEFNEKTQNAAMTNCNLYPHQSPAPWKKSIENNLCPSTTKEIVKRSLQSPLQCLICNKSFTRIEDLESHTRSNRRHYGYQCCICNTQFSSNIDLNNHARLHTGEMPFQCFICNTNFTFESQLNSHMSEHRTEMFQCSICNTKFKFAGHLKMHMSLHRPETFECFICNMKFTVKSQFSVHMLSHNTEKRFQCSFCNMRFTSLSKLTIHRRLHSEEPFQCSICNTKFKFETQFYIHMSLHTAGKI